MELVLSAELLLGLFTAALLAGLVDTLAGGGGMITLPALLLAQVPPIQALATNKLQGSFGTLTAAFNMLKNRMVSWREIRRPFCYSLVGAALGTWLIQQLSPGALKLIIPIAMLLLGCYLLLNPAVGLKATPAKIGKFYYDRLVVPLIGFYDGFFGPGTGSFFTVAGVYYRGATLIEATARAKLLNFASNIASLGLFVFLGQVVWLVGAVMIAGQIAGAQIGSRVIVKGQIGFIRPLLITLCFIVAGRYFWLFFIG